MWVASSTPTSTWVCPDPPTECDVHGQERAASLHNTSISPPPPRSLQAQGTARSYGDAGVHAGLATGVCAGLPVRGPAPAVALSPRGAPRVAPPPAFALSDRWGFQHSAQPSLSLSPRGAPLADPRARALPKGLPARRPPSTRARALCRNRSVGPARGEMRGWAEEAAPTGLPGLGGPLPRAPLWRSHPSDRARRA